MIRRLFLVPALVLVAVVALASVAGAHVDLEPGDAVAGSTTLLTFSFRHGKDGSATTGLEVLLPDGASVVDVPAVDGWRSAVDEETGTITWTGGPVPDGTEARFPVEVQLPATAGVALFKTIQTTEAAELAWIEEEESEAEGAYPAPRLTLAADPADPAERLPGTSLEAEERDDGTTSAAPWIIGSGLAAVAVVGIGGLVLKRRTG